MTGFSLRCLQRRKARKAAAAQAYTLLMKAALAPGFFVSGDVDDTFEGRAQMVTLHAALAIRRLNGLGGTDAVKLADALNAKVLDGFDAAYREQGVGDSSIARKVRRLAETHYGLGTALAQALETGGVAGRDAAVREVLERNGVTAKGRAGPLSDRLCAQADRLEAQPEGEILTGAFDWLALSKVP